jgi:prolyl-tRNA editing enzyme YbaK/EbsC (Cys-tRNA(Pro) deacylase)
MITVELAQELADERLDYELITHDRTLSARREAQTLGIDPSRVAKTVVLTDGYGDFVRVVVPATRRVDMQKAWALLGYRFRLATERELVGAYPMFELGAVPPFGGPKDTVVVDESFAADGPVVIEAGTHEQSMRLPAKELISVSRAWIADIAC